MFTISMWTLFIYSCRERLSTRWVALATGWQIVWRFKNVHHMLNKTVRKRAHATQRETVMSGRELFVENHWAKIHNNKHTHWWCLHHGIYSAVHAVANNVKWGKELEIAKQWEISCSQNIFLIHYGQSILYLQRKQLFWQSQ